MPKIRFPVGDIQGLQPAIDTRGVQKPYGSGNKTYALEGRNFYFDTKGPKSGFGTRLVADNSIIENAGGVVQSITAGKATYVFTSKGCYVMADNRKSWIRVLDLAARWPDVPLKDDKKWTFVYLSKGIYFCHPVYGFYKVVKTPTDYYLDPRDQNDIFGLPFQPQAICETNGRMVVLGFKYVAWSGPSNAEDFLPALGGAGQELLSDRVAGTPVTCVGFQTGFIVWTSQGCLTAEFIGGDTVFRFNRATTEQLPVNAYAVEALPDGSQVICTKQGVFQIQNAQEPQLIAPLFSEFIKRQLEHENGIHVRLTYQLEEDLLFFQMRDWTNHYVHTYVLSISLDKWGTFDERHLGIIKLIPDRGQWGYVDKDGRPHRFVETYNREVRPHQFIGLDSSITIGYIRPPELLAETDSLQEMHEINIGGHPAIPSWYPVDDIDLGRLPNVLRLQPKGQLHLHGNAAAFTLRANITQFGVSKVSVSGAGIATWAGGQIDISTNETLVVAILREANIGGSTTTKVTANGTELTRVALSPDASPLVIGSNSCFLEFWTGKPAAGVNIALTSTSSTTVTGFTFAAWKINAVNSGNIGFAYGSQDATSGTVHTVSNIPRSIGTSIFGVIAHATTVANYAETWTGIESVFEMADTDSATNNNRFAAFNILSQQATSTDDLTLTSSATTSTRLVAVIGIGP